MKAVGAWSGRGRPVTGLTFSARPRRDRRGAARSRREDPIGCRGCLFHPHGRQMEELVHDLRGDRLDRASLALVEPSEQAIRPSAARLRGSPRRAPAATRSPARRRATRATRGTSPPRPRRSTQPARPRGGAATASRRRSPRGRRCRRGSSRRARRIAGSRSRGTARSTSRSRRPFRSSSVRPTRGRESVTSTSHADGSRSAASCCALTNMSGGWSWPMPVCSSDGSCATISRVPPGATAAARWAYTRLRSALGKCRNWALTRSNASAARLPRPEVGLLPTDPVRDVGRRVRGHPVAGPRPRRPAR